MKEPTPSLQTLPAWGGLHTLSLPGATSSGHSQVSQGKGSSSEKEGDRRGELKGVSDIQRNSDAAMTTLTSMSQGHGSASPPPLSGRKAAFPDRTKARTLITASPNHFPQTSQLITELKESHLERTGRSRGAGGAGTARSAVEVRSLRAELSSRRQRRWAGTQSSRRPPSLPATPLPPAWHQAVSLKTGRGQAPSRTQGPSPASATGRFNCFNQ